MSVREATRFGRYELLTELGRGGMAELHLARMSGIGGFTKLVAVKLMLPHLSQNKQFVDQFLNEGRIAARISHPNVCQVFEIGEDAGQLFLVMEYLEGVTWEELLRVVPADPITKLRVTTGVLAQACEGLYYAHDLRDTDGTPSPVIHRDISPQNLFVTIDGVCKVLDFGVAKMVNDVSNTRSGMLKGKIPYMSPEQLRGEELDTRSDVFATGVVLWEALANRSLFMREVEFLIWKAVLEDKIDPVSKWEPAFGEDVDSLVMKTLDRDREHRFATMRELAEALRQLGDSWGGAFTPADIGELVRKKCGDKLAKRQVEIAALATMRDGQPEDAAWRKEATLEHDAVAASVMLRADSVPLAAKRKPFPLALGAAGFVASAGLAFFLVRTLGPDEAEQAAAVAAAPVDAAVDATVVVAQVAIDAPAPEPVAVVTPDPPPDPLPVTKDPAVKGRTAKRRVPARVEKRPTETVQTPPPVANLAPGLLSVDVKPSARVYIDGMFVDDTPLYRHKLSAGKHELRLVPPDGTPYKRVIKIEPGKPLNLGTVRW